VQLTRRIVNGDMSFGQGLANMCTGSESVAQNVVTRLRTFKGEWFLDLDAGVGYLQDIFVKPANVPLSEADLKAEIIKTDGVATLNSFQFNLNHVTRQATLSADVVTIYGDTINIQVTL
jgi:hypothetical protein